MKARFGFFATTLVTAALMAGVIAQPVQAAGPELITNGSFEDPDIPSGSFSIIPSIPGWSHEQRAGATSFGIELQDHSAGVPAAGAGDQFVELDSDGPSRIYQDIVTVVGRTYDLTFLYSARPGTASVQNHFIASAGDASVEVGPLSSAGTTVWQLQTLTFEATASSTRIEFVDLGPEEGQGGLGAYIDTVSVVEQDAAFSVCVLYDQAKAHRSGSTVPIKLQLCDADGNNLSSPTIVVHAVSLTRLDNTASSSVEDSGSANPDDDFRYSGDLDGGGYIFNKSTRGLSAGTWLLRFTVDGASHDSYQTRFDIR